MKRFLSFLSIFISFVGFSQVGINTTSPDPAAELHVVSTSNNTGVLIPTLTDAQMSGIANPTKGLLVYNTTRNRFMYNAGTPATPLWSYVGSIPVVETLAGLPTIAGDIRYNAADNKMYFYNGSAWRELIP
ncbi:MAG: hypothetical protein SNJ71_02240 [Bacteroidales bacterium]